MKTELAELRASIDEAHNKIRHLLDTIYGKLNRVEALQEEAEKRKEDEQFAKKWRVVRVIKGDPKKLVNTPAFQIIPCPHRRHTKEQRRVIKTVRAFLKDTLEGISVGHLAMKSEIEMLRFNGLGKVSVGLIRSCMHVHGLTLGIISPYLGEMLEHPKS